MPRNLIEYQGEAGHITGVVVEGDGGREVLPADVCVVGAGVVPGTSYFKKSEAAGLIKFARDGSVLVDEVCTLSSSLTHILQSSPCFALLSHLSFSLFSPDPASFSLPLSLSFVSPYF